jgi:hypothetical protein
MTGDSLITSFINPANASLARFPYLFAIDVGQLLTSLIAGTLSAFDSII